MNSVTDLYVPRVLVAWWIERPPSVMEVMGSIPVGKSFFFFVTLGTCSLLHLSLMYRVHFTVGLNFVCFFTWPGTNALVMFWLPCEVCTESLANITGQLQGGRAGGEGGCKTSALGKRRFLESTMSLLWLVKQAVQIHSMHIVFIFGKSGFFAVTSLETGHFYGN